MWSVKARLFMEDKARVVHMHTDPACNHTAIGTEMSISLWDLEQGCRVKGSKIIHQDADMLVYVEPHVFILGEENGVETF